MKNEPTLLMMAELYPVLLVAPIPDHSALCITFPRVFTPKHPIKITATSGDMIYKYHFLPGYQKLRKVSEYINTRHVKPNEETQTTPETNI